MDPQTSALLGGGLMGARMRAYDWATTSLGPQEHWPQPLLTLVRVMLNSRQPMFIAWGADRTLVYNDTYAQILGERHPAALGRPFFETWPEVRDAVGALMDRVFAGDPVHMEDLALTLHRNGYPEATHFAFSYTPVPGDDGTIVGLFCACTETTRQVLAERQAASERRRQQALLQQMPGFVAVLRDPSHIFEYVNDAYITVAGRRDYIGRNVREVFPELVGQGFYELLDQVYATGEPFVARSQPIRLVGEDSTRYLDFIYQPIRDQAGAVIGIFAGGYEVSDQIRSQVALAESEGRYRTLFESIDVGFCIIEVTFDAADRAVDYRILEANPAFERQTGADVAGRWVSDFAPDLERHWFDTYGHVALTGEPAHIENKADVFGRWFDVRALRVGDPAARRVAVFFSDISERKRMEEALQVLNATLEQQVHERTAERDQLWRLSEDMLARANYEGMMSAVSPSWTRVLGWSEAELLSRPYGTFMHPDDMGPTLAALAQMGKTTQPTRFENRIATSAGGWKPIEWTVAPEADGANFIAVGRDLTIAKTREAELASAQEALRQAQKMEAVGQLTGGVAHDFNNLLTVIKSSTDLLKRPGLPEERRQRYVGAISDTVARAAKLTGQLLAFARRQALKPEVIDAGRSVTTISDMVGTLSGSRIRIVTAIPDAPCFINADPSQFDTALVNMAVNARDAMDGEGTLTITVNPVSTIPPIRTHPAVSGDFIAVCIEDTGSGIAPEQIEHIFEPFFTTKGVGQGTGLGLSQVFGFAKQSGGEVRVQSTVGQGTTFVLYLPRVEAPGHVPQVEPEPVVDGHGMCVLVVEDNAEVGTFATQTLAELGYVTVWAIDAEAALAELAKDADRFDVVFTDVVMPGMNGIDLAHRIRRDHHDLPVLLASGYSHVLARNGTHGFELLHKPYSVEQLSRLLRKVATWQRRKRIMGEVA
ncbi:PAS domain-containing protein [Methylobacterium sp. J-070]|uniref:PAS domain-containing protein n=1 Tax=Methylobacterium sp. J-070 TaxID=2836650 RepID=UPI001FBAB081|nr:PAS domain-containing protein [Methylobacterium sp. J-070]MCJ2050023.1 PAS domain-containing protein [Methylobacterium sp. J-070]